MMGEENRHPTLINMSKAICDHLKSTLEPSLIILFGSMAAHKEISRADSDVDIAFLPRKDARMNAYEVFATAQDLAELLGRDVDLVDLTKASDVMRMQVVTKGILLYDQTGFYPEYTVRTLKEYVLYKNAVRQMVDDYKERMLDEVL